MNAANSIHNLLAQLSDRQVSVVLADGDLHLRPKGRLTEELIAQLRIHKEDIVAILEQRRATPAGGGLSLAELVDPGEWTIIDTGAAAEQAWDAAISPVDSRRLALPCEWDAAIDLSDDDRSYLRAPLANSRCPWCGGRTRHHVLCDQQRRSWFVLEFGKHRDQPITAVRASYLRWMLREMRLSAEQVALLRQELDVRVHEPIAPQAPSYPQPPAGRKLYFQTKTGRIHQIKAVRQVPPKDCIRWTWEGADDWYPRELFKPPPRPP